MKNINVDRGYAWWIVVGSFFAHVFQYGIVWTVGIFYDVFLDTFRTSATATSLVSSLNTATYYLTGPLARILYDRYGARTMAMVGGFIGNMGLILSMFATNIYHLQVTFGFITGFGFGLAYIPAVSIVCMYFEERRSIALGLAVSGCGVGTMIFPHLIQWLINTYGWRGGLLMTAGVCMNMVACGAIMRPPDHRLNRTVQALKEMKKSNSNNSVSKSSQDILGIFNCRIFTNTSYLILCINNFFICFGLSIIYVHLAAYGRTLGFSASQGATLFTVLGAANFIGRIAFGLFAQMPFLSGMGLYTVAFFLTGAMTELAAYFTTYAALVCYAVTFGFLTAALGTLLPVLLEDILGIEMRDSGYGYLLIFEGLGTILGSPVAGFVYDSTGVYQTSLYLGGASIMFSSVLMTYPWFCAPHRKHTPQEIVTVDVPADTTETKPLRETTESKC